MCGIVGFISGAGNKGWPQDRAKFIKQGLVVDSLRGMDSTGFFSVDVGSETKTAAWLKNALVGGEFVRTKDYADMMSDPKRFRAVIGHNRSATIGSVTVDNAHPFQEGAITLVHNGTLSSTYGMPLPERTLKDVEVDSHAIAHNLDHSPIEEWYKDMYGAWALIWHDARDGSINIVRNEQRPLHIAKVRGEETITICSEADMLSFVATRCTMQLEEMYSLDPHTHFKWLPDTPVLSPITSKLERSYYSGGYSGKRSKRGWEYDDSYWDAWNDDYTSRAKGVSPIANPPAAEERDHLFLCGSLRPIPEEFQLALCELELEPSDRLTFAPWEVVVPKKTGMVAVGGWLVENELPAIVYGVPSSMLSANGKVDSSKKWTVRPIGVTEPDHAESAQGADGPYVLCKFVVSYQIPRARPIPPAMGNERLVTAIGPSGVRVSLETFQRLVEDGCVRCKGVISFLDDEDLVWTDDRKPLCHVCQSVEKERSA